MLYPEHPLGFLRFCRDAGGVFYSPGRQGQYARRIIVTQTSVESHQLKLVQKTHKKWNNQNNMEMLEHRNGKKKLYEYFKKKTGDIEHEKT